MPCVETGFANACTAGRQDFTNGTEPKSWRLAVQVTIDTRELQDLGRRLERAGRATPKNFRSMLTEIGLIIWKVARDYCPQSPSKTQYVATLKRGETKRSPTSFTRGQLRNSITTEVFDDRVEIGVPSNSPGGSYAEKIHDERGKSWNKLGVGNDDNQYATDKFIFNAATDTERVWMKKADEVVERIIKEI